jgi:carbon monoxide dehydrogenase subunit G
MTTFESNIKTINAPAETIFGVVGDLRNIAGHLDKIPEEKLKVTKIEAEAVYFNVELAGEIGLKIIDKEPFTTIKFETVNSPVQMNLWVQLKEIAPADTRLKITVKSDLNPVVKVMLAKPIEEFLNKLADAIAQYNYTV